MITKADVLACVKARWDATAELPRLMPGGLWFGRVDENATGNYASLKVVPDDPKHTSTGAYLQDFEVTVSVWTTDGPGKDAAQVEQALCWAFDNRRIPFAIRGARVVRVRPVAGELEQDESLRNAQDVCLMRAAWKFTIQGNRNTR